MKPPSPSPSQTPGLHPVVDADALRLLVESTTDYAIFMLDPAGFIRSWNAGAERMYGYASGEVTGKHFSSFYPPEALARNWPATELEFAQRDGRLEDEGWRVRKDGTTFWANVVITALRDGHGNLIGFGKVSRDLTERKRAEQQLQESEERFRLIVESVIDYAIFMLDPRGHVVSWNAGAQRIKGYAADEIIGRHFSQFYPAEAVARGWPAYELQEAERVGRFEDEGWRVRKDGTMFWANVTITALRGPDGGLRGFAKVTRDMTERKANEDRIQLLTRELQGRVAELGATNRELAQKTTENESFVYSVSHDLRSPLVNLQGFSQELALASGTLRELLLAPDVPDATRQRALAILDGDFQESIAFIRNAVQHLGNIIDGLLRLSRVGRIEYNSEPVDVGAVVADIVAAMHSTVVASGARIEIGQLPTAVGDRNAIGQIFANLIGNALKSFHPDRPGVIRISASQDDPSVFEVRDNGVGVPRDYQAKLFQPFQHVHSAVTRGEGMGLAIVRRIVERHGGRIWFESVPGEGSAFFFTLAGALAGARQE
jgi:PAS domain S-box-containing protein